jgi:hypothetical protein
VSLYLENPSDVPLACQFSTPVPTTLFANFAMFRVVAHLVIEKMYSIERPTS